MPEMKVMQVAEEARLLSTLTAEVHTSPYCEMGLAQNSLHIEFAMALHYI